MIRRLPFVFLIALVSVALLSAFMPLVMKQSLYAIALSIKAVILFVLPMIILILIFQATVKLSRAASSLLLLIVSMVMFSNFLATYLAHFFGQWLYTWDFSLQANTSQDTLQPLWELSLKPFFANRNALILGVVSGFVLPWLLPKQLQKIYQYSDKVVYYALKLVQYLMPLFVGGFIVKMQHDGVLGVMLQDYPQLFACVFVAQLVYLALGMLLLFRGHFLRIKAFILQMLPAAGAGFTTMSSATAMPLTILGVQKGSKEPELVSSVVPATVNIHLIGDCIAIPLLAYALLGQFGLELPSSSAYLLFTGYFVLAKFSVAAVPGGGILVMLPILEQHLGFTPEMLSLITALYILFDPVITSVNIFGNALFAKVVEWFYIRFGFGVRVQPVATA